ncbi:hypothetical protein WL71_17095 [Burkholderia ubonensis]|uniref:Uncharacterized protein n=1 Tax=Burkholderia ubonensis TaxID=101571 RepID=A0A107FM22_9BURK|nr:hypothetical protein WL70_21225 [Burkholderia ubonensis]KWD83307.1 hypothetical protein WL71_17095 [Burkholderia ubonensis]KWD96025.1 hypothetical protein WL73_23985 [Burkholderia ubonensis]KWE04041.1 hypothetical protein WL72_02345 [Burkholderia ubonensis]
MKHGFCVSSDLFRMIIYRQIVLVAVDSFIKKLQLRNYLGKIPSISLLILRGPLNESRNAI